MNEHEGNTDKLRIMMISDFFYPSLGGVETHILQLTRCLLELGHHVIVVTHHRNKEHGVRYISQTHLANECRCKKVTQNQIHDNIGVIEGDDSGKQVCRVDIKVYYLPFWVFYENNTFPIIISHFPIIRNIIIRERIQVVHGHQVTSALSLETIFHSKTIGCKTVYTDHSLHELSDAASIAVNKLGRSFLADIDQAICVSRAGKNNLVRRSLISQEVVAVIPNAVNTNEFRPIHESDEAIATKTINRDFARSNNPCEVNLSVIEDSSDSRHEIKEITEKSVDTIVTIVVMSRLTYRKGADLLCSAIPIICAQFSYIRWLIGGDGVKRPLLEKMITENSLGDIVSLIGKVDNRQVRDILVQGDIFVNCSLTEAFCIALLEASSCGLSVVSTDVGGVREVLPTDMITLCKPNVHDLCSGIKAAVEIEYKLKTTSAESVLIQRRMQRHNRLRSMYSWAAVARSTVELYENISIKKVEEDKNWMRDRLLKFWGSGPLLGNIMACLVIFSYILCVILEWWMPASSIEESVDLPMKCYCCDYRRCMKSSGRIDALNHCRKGNTNIKENKE